MAGRDRDELHADVLIVAFWTGVCLGAGMLIPGVIGFGLLALTAHALRRRVDR